MLVVAEAIPPATETHIVDEAEERDYCLMEEISKRRHLPFLQGAWMLETFDRTGRLVHRHRERAHSTTRNYYNWLFSQGASSNGDGSSFIGGQVSIKDTSAVHRTGASIITITNANVELTLAVHGFLAASAIDTRGIVVGSGTNAFSFEDFVLQTPIANGTGAGQLSYVASELPVLSYVGGTLTLTHTHVRFFNNNSGGSVTVNEVAMYVRFIAGDSNTIPAAVERTKLGATVTVLNTGQLKVTYTVNLVYAA
jgi:hypothetical protein